MLLFCMFNICPFQQPRRSAASHSSLFMAKLSISPFIKKRKQLDVGVNAVMKFAHLHQRKACNIIKISTHVKAWTIIQPHRDRPHALHLWFLDDHTYPHGFLLQSSFCGKRLARSMCKSITIGRKPHQKDKCTNQTPKESGCHYLEGKSFFGLRWFGVVTRWF